MALVINGVTKRIGLALSGGGFRAAAFHLGVMRKLAAMRTARQARPPDSCVSGGSIAGAALVAELERADGARHPRHLLAHASRSRSRR